MNDFGSVADFFYNLIPGILFLFISKLLFGFDVIKQFGFSEEPFQTDVNIFITYIIMGLFLGFLFQCFTKIFRDICWNERAFKKVKCDSIEEFDYVCEYVFKKEYKINCNSTKKIFYLMDNSLRGIKSAFLPTHFSSRFAFWANISWGTFILIIVNSILVINISINFYLLVFLLFSFWMADQHLYSFYDSILKTFYMKNVSIKK